MTQTTAGAGQGPFSAHELKGRDFAPLQFVVDGLIPLGLTVLAGAPKVGKSWLSLDIALSVARGNAVPDENAHRCAKGAVLYLALEDNDRRLRGRLEQLLGTCLLYTSRTPIGPDEPSPSSARRKTRRTISASTGSISSFRFVVRPIVSAATER